MSFYKKIFFTIFLTATVIGSGLIFATNRYFEKQSTETFVSRYRVFTKVLSDTLSRLDSNTEALMLNAAKVLKAQDSEKGILSTSELMSLRDELNVTHLFVVDNKGNFVRSTNEDPKLIPNAFSFCPDYKKMITGEVAKDATPIIKPNPEPKPYKFLFIPSKDRRRLLEVGVRVDFIAKTLTEAVSSDKNVLSMSLFSPVGESFGHFSSSKVEFDHTKIQLPETLPAIVESSEAYHFYSKVISSHPQCCQCDVSGTSRNGEYYYVLESKVSKAEVKAAVAATNTVFSVLAFANLLFSFLFARVVSKRLVRKLEAATAKVKLIKANGDVKGRINLSGEDEVSFLTNEFDKLLAEREQALIQQMEAEKVKAKVLMAKEIAHNIRSPIIAIEMMLPMMDKMPDKIKSILKCSVKEIKALSDRLKYQAETLSVDMNNADTELMFLPIIVKDLVAQKSLEYSLYENIKINFEFNLNAKMAFTKGCSIELKSILSNMINNSVEALPNKSGEIMVSLSSNDGEAQISISDNGAGIPEECISEIGRKPISFKGSKSRGLGLTHAFKVIESWGGSIKVNSLVGSGTTIQIFLPGHAKNIKDSNVNLNVSSIDKEINF